MKTPLIKSTARKDFGYKRGVLRYGVNADRMILSGK
jgi:hypothetical protein